MRHGTEQGCGDGPVRRAAAKVVARAPVVAGRRARRVRVEATVIARRKRSGAIGIVRVRRVASARRAGRRKRRTTARRRRAPRRGVTRRRRVVRVVRAVTRIERRGAVARRRAVVVVSKRGRRPVVKVPPIVPVVIPGRRSDNRFYDPPT